LAVFDGRALALDETAEVEEEEEFNNCTFHFCDNYCKNDE
jgi:hypothetical protein